MANNKFNKRNARGKYSKGTDDTHMKGGKSRTGGNRIKDRRTDGADARYESETATPSMKNPNVKSARNDASWYTYSSDVLNIGGSINYNDCVGIPFADTAQDIGTGTLRATDPSVMVLYWTPTPGMISDDDVLQRKSGNAPVNLQLRSLYSLMQATVTQNLPFAAADLGIHLMYMDSVYLYYGALQRLYYILRYYRVMNRTVPGTLLAAYGLNSTGSSSNWFGTNYSMNDFQADLLMIEQEIKRIAIPEGFDILNRHYWMSKHIFKDADSPKAQLYLFSPHSVWAFDPEGETGGELKQFTTGFASTTGNNTIKNVIAKFRAFLETFYNDKDVWTMNGYILRAFDKFWIPDPLDIAGIVEPVYVPEVLTQIHHATPINGNLYGYNNSTETYKKFARIYQTVGDNIAWSPAVKYDSNIKTYGAIADERVMVDMPQVLPTPADTMVATRLIVRTASGPVTVPDSSDKVLELYCHGTEIVNYIAIFDGANPTWTLNTYSIWGTNMYTTLANGTFSVAQSEVFKLSEASKFTEAPLWPITLDHTDSDDELIFEWFDYSGTLDNYTIVDSNVIMKLHDAAALGLWLIK